MKRWERSPSPSSPSTTASTSQLQNGQQEHQPYNTDPLRLKAPTDTTYIWGNGSDSPNHPIGGAEPEKCFLDVIPEAREVYKKREVKRKRPGTWTPLQDSYRGDSSGDSDSDSEPVLPQPPSLYSHPLVHMARKRKRRALGFHDIIYKIDDLMKDFRLTDETYVDLGRLLEREMAAGLRRDSHHAAAVRMYPTYVHRTPDGTESGRFLALDLGGTNFRVLLVDLHGPEQPAIRSRLFLISPSLMTGSGEQLFNYIAACIAEFQDQEGLKGLGRLPLGFTFSFPCSQEGLASARLVRWTKGFTCSGVVGEDVVQLLKRAIDKRGDLDVDIVAIINDPVGALMAGAHTDRDCMVGLILGTGTNCCYMERVSRVETWADKDAHAQTPEQVIVNTEWGAFGDNHCLDFLRNVFDRELDKTSLNPGHQLFEKMISGMYMGEIVRLVLCELVSHQLLFGGEASESLYVRNAFLTKYISEIEGDDPGGMYENTKLVLQELDVPHFTIDDCRHVQHVCWQVSQRAAYLAGTAVATVVRRLDRPAVTVAVDGSLYRFHPHFKDLMAKKITQLLPPQHKFKLVLSHDGSGKGAALVAAVGRQNPAQLQRAYSLMDSEEQDTTSSR